MRTHIDWLTFTLSPVWVSNIPEGGFEDAYINALMDGIIVAFPCDLVEMALAGSWEKREKSRAPYTDAWSISEKGITVFANPALKHFCVEISGSGCEELIAKGLMSGVLAAVHERVTRIDIACDIQTDVKPSEFALVTTHERMRASGYQISETGETHYVGSQKSDRYARVYRYNPPHPRCNLLRVEHVFRREYAKVVAQQCSSADLVDIAQACRKAFGWGHRTWQVSGNNDLDISVHEKDRNGGRTLYWLVNSCAPAFRRLCEQGVFDDPMAFLEKHFLPNQ